MQSRVVQFVVHHVIAQEQFIKSPVCPESWARWLIADSVAYAAKPVLQLPPAMRKRPLPALPFAQVDEDELEQLPEASQ